MGTVHRMLLAGLAALPLFLPSAHGAEGGNKPGVAVIIGNKAYADSRLRDVSYAHNDAEAFKRFVTGRLGFDPRKVMYLRDATKTQMESAFGSRDVPGRLYRWAQGDGGPDIVVFYSGHGGEGTGKTGGYLLPVDANKDTAEANGYPIAQLYENLGKMPHKSVTVFLDACFSGVGGESIDNASPVTRGAVLSGVQGVAGMTVLTAASGNQWAYWDAKSRHGLFTEHLLNGLYGDADLDKDGSVTAGEAKMYLDQNMSWAARTAYGSEQDAGLLGDEKAVLSISPVDGWGSRPLLGPPPAAFTVLVEPANARVRILNIGPAYRAGMELAVGSYLVEASAEGYLTKTSTVAHGVAPTLHRMALMPLMPTGAPFTVRTGPPNAHVQIMNIGHRYEPGIRLPPGSYAAKVSAVGFDTVERTLRHENEPTDVWIGLPFRDCPVCPKMVEIPTGSYRMGTSEQGEGNAKIEGPVHDVAIRYRLAVGMFEVSFEEWDSCKRDGGCQVPLQDEGSGGAYPIDHATMGHAREYTKWLKDRTGRPYRLPSEAEWEYAARAGTQSERYWGQEDQCAYANGADLVAQLDRPDLGVFASCGDGYTRTAPSDDRRFAPNAWGLYHMLGNVHEWTQDCWVPNYLDAPADGRPREDCEEGGAHRVVRGGSWSSAPRWIRARMRHAVDPGASYNDLGFRVVVEVSR